MKLKNTIRQKLFEKKEEKKYLIKEDKVIYSRFKIILESKQIRKRSDLNNLLFSLLSEMISLHNKGYNNNLISENLTNVLGALDNLFKGTNTPVIEIFKRKGIDFIVNQLKIGEPSLKTFLTEYLSDIEIKDVPKLFTDCEFLKNKISDSIPVYYNNKIDSDLSSGVNDEFTNVIQTSLKSLIQSGDFSDRVNSRLSNIVCPIIEKLSVKFEDHLKKMKSKLIS